MKAFPKQLELKIETRKKHNALRKLPSNMELVDFSSNDYLGFAQSQHIFQKVPQLLAQKNMQINGAAGSRLLSGNHNLYQETEHKIALFHNAASALIFNSGYDANLGFFSSVPQRDTFIFYDEYIHASIRDGIALSHAKSYKFRHNDLNHLEKQLSKIQATSTYIVTESVFSMDGDSPDIKALVALCRQYQCYLIVDEAHALGVFGHQGRGLLQELGVEQEVFARIVTFGKGLGCHGAAILGSTLLQEYLVNFARSFIYTTALSPHAVATIQLGYDSLQNMQSMESTPASTPQMQLRQAIAHFNAQIKTHPKLAPFFIPSQSAIHCAIISGNDRVKKISHALQDRGFGVKPILSPTVPAGQERIRFCLHSYNSLQEISDVLAQLATFVQ